MRVNELQTETRRETHIWSHDEVGNYEDDVSTALGSEPCRQVIRGATGFWASRRNMPDTEQMGTTLSWWMETDEDYSSGQWRFTCVGLKTVQTAAEGNRQHEWENRLHVSCVRSRPPHSDTLINLPKVRMTGSCGSLTFPTVAYCIFHWNGEKKCFDV